MRTRHFRGPTTRDLIELVAALRTTLDDDYRSASSELDDATPSMDLTVATDGLGKWVYQTGDNSYTGSAYGCAHWAVVTLTRDCDARYLARDIRNQLLDAWHQSGDADVAHELNRTPF